MEFKINNKKISSNSPTYFIAEIGSNFDGSIERAIALIKLAKESGADAAKFQHYTAKSLVSQEGFEKIDLKTHQSNWKESVFDIYEKASLDINWTKTLFDECKKLGLDFLTSPYSQDLLEKTINYIPAIKVGSGDITYKNLLESMARYSKPILIATGASTLDDVKKALEIFYGKVPVCIMQCNTNYEAKPEDDKYQNLNVLLTYKKLWPDAQIGLSCHMKGHLSVISAVSMGARVIEKHFTDDDSRPGPDHGFAMNPKSFRNMVDDVRKLERMLGTGEKIIEENELSTYQVQRRSITIKKNLFKDDIIKSEDIEFLRPFIQDSYRPDELEKVIGKKLNRDLVKGTSIIRNYLKD